MWTIQQYLPAAWAAYLSQEEEVEPMIDDLNDDQVPECPLCAYPFQAPDDLKLLCDRGITQYDRSGRYPCKTDACTHVYCMICMQKWKEHHKGCPICRADIHAYKLIPDRETMIKVLEMRKFMFGDVKEESHVEEDLLVELFNEPSFPESYFTIYDACECFANNLSSRLDIHDQEMIALEEGRYRDAGNLALDLRINMCISHSVGIAAQSGAIAGQTTLAAISMMLLPSSVLAFSFTTVYAGIESMFTCECPFDMIGTVFNWGICYPVQYIAATSINIPVRTAKLAKYLLCCPVNTLIPEIAYCCGQTICDKYLEESLDLCNCRTLGCTFWKNGNENVCYANNDQYPAIFNLRSGNFWCRELL
ncbi:MAG: hypothetical protein H7A37_06965 [Chlamydiales bacterium]|nr:hypothetical protein [Chlamydiia bacterium]MCP5508023.1 hypothetical protein [Chlamydiales bacterium]